jgi:hypothetical protein
MYKIHTKIYIYDYNLRVKIYIVTSLVTRCGVLISNWVYWTITNCNYKELHILTNLHAMAHVNSS